MASRFLSQLRGPFRGENRPRAVVLRRAESEELYLVSRQDMQRIWAKMAF